MSKIRFYFLNIIYIVLLIEVALNKGGISEKEYCFTTKTIENAISKIIKEHEKIEKKNEEILKKITKNNEDFERIKKIKEICESEKKKIWKINVLKNKIIEKSGGYKNIEEKQLANPNDKYTIKKMIPQLNELLNDVKETKQRQINDKNNNINLEKTNKEKVIETIEIVDTNDKITPQKKINNKKTNTQNIFDKKTKNKEIKKENTQNIFGKLTVKEALLKLSLMELTLLEENSVKINKINSEISEKKTSFNNFNIVVKPKQNTITMGQAFEADVFLTSQNSDIDPIIKVNDNIISLEKGVGKIKHTPQNVVFDKNGNSKQTLDVYLCQKDQNTNDIILNKKVNFTVTNNSYIEGVHTTNTTLYKNCWNKYKIKNLAQDINDEIKFTFHGGELKITNKTSNDFDLILKPTENKCYLHVFNRNIKISTFPFTANDIEKPNVDIALNGKRVNDNSEITPEDIKNILIYITPNKYFENEYPDEAHYKTEHFIIFFLKGENVRATKEISKQDYYKLEEDDKENLKKSDKIVIKIDRISRVYCVDNKKEEIRENNIFKSNEFISHSFKIKKTKNTDDEED